jgi:hypothetical protein
MHMSIDTSIRVSERTKAKLARQKREDETWDELLDRLAGDGDEPIEVGAWSEDEAERAREAIERSRESFE